MPDVRSTTSAAGAARQMAIRDLPPNLQAIAQKAAGAGKTSVSTADVSRYLDAFAAQNRDVEVIRDSAGEPVSISRADLLAGINDQVIYDAEKVVDLFKWVDRGDTFVPAKRETLLDRAVGGLFNSTPSSPYNNEGLPTTPLATLGWVASGIKDLFRGGR